MGIWTAWAKFRLTEFHFPLRSTLNVKETFKKVLTETQIITIVILDRVNLIAITNKMRPCSRIYYSNVS